MTSAPRSFTTGAPPSSFVFPLFTVRQGPDPGTDLQESTVVHLLLTTSPNVGPAAKCFQTDLTEWGDTEDGHSP